MFDWTEIPREVAMTNDVAPEYAGPNVDGSQSIARESKYGNVVNGLVTAFVLGLASAIGDVDFTPLPDVLEALLVPVVPVLVGLLTSWATRNRKIRPFRR